VAAAGGAGFLIAGTGGLIAATVLVLVVRRRRHARSLDATATATSGEVADALRRITDELRAGAHPAAALTGARGDGPLAAAVLADAAAAARLGDDVPRALRRVAAQCPGVAADLLRIAGSWSLAERHGVPLADLLDRARSDIAWRVGYARRVQAQLAGPRATAVVLSVLPGLGLLLGQLLGADPVGVLRDGALGQTLLVTGVGLATAGFTWCDRILRTAVRS
jgi:tight adherence protein B